MKYIAVKNQKYLVENTVGVQWRIGNSCSWKCSYCPTGVNSGSAPFPKIEDAKKFINKLHKNYTSKNKIVNFSLVGGEPTEWEQLPEFLQACKDAGFSTQLMTNAAPELAWWEKHKFLFSTVDISFHYGKSNFKHVRTVCEILKNGFANTHVKIMMLPEHFAELESIYNNFISVGIDCTMGIIYKDYGRNSRPYDYTELQIQKIKQSNEVIVDHEKPPIVVEEEHKHELTHNPVEKQLEKKNNYQGMLCYAGIEQLIVNWDGNITGSWCYALGKIGNIADANLRLPTEPITCPLEQCVNGLDQTLTKIKPGVDIEDI